LQDCQVASLDFSPCELPCWAKERSIDAARKPSGSDRSQRSADTSALVSKYVGFELIAFVLVKEMRPREVSSESAYDKPNSDYPSGSLKAIRVALLYGKGNQRADTDPKEET